LPAKEICKRHLRIIETNGIRLHVVVEAQFRSRSRRAARASGQRATSKYM
jgi:hypothetical protein